MKILTSLTCIFFLSISNLNAQEDDLDAIFDDGNANRKFGLNLGMDAVTLMAGTLNIYGEAIFKEKFGVFVGTGLMPFGYLADFSEPGAFLSEDGTALVRDFKRSRFLDLGMKLLQKKGSFSYYYYVGFKSWRWTTFPDSFDTLVTSRRKFNFGSGYTFAPIDKFQFDLHAGIYMGSDVSKLVLDTYKSINLRVGFDLGFSMFYKF